jgi:hypothetical protein
LAHSLGSAKIEAVAYPFIGMGYWKKGDYSKALDYLNKTLVISIKINDKLLQAKVFST